MLQLDAVNTKVSWRDFDSITFAYHADVDVGMLKPNLLLRHACGFRLEVSVQARISANEGNLRRGRKLNE